MPSGTNLLYCSLYGLLVFLLSHATVRSLDWHAVAGVAFFSLIAIHIVGVRNFYRYCLKGTYTPYRLMLTVTAFSLIPILGLVVTSSLYATGLVFNESPFRFTLSMRVLHLTSASWLFMLVSLHLALQPCLWLKRLEERCSVNARRKALLTAFYFFLIVLGAYAFIHSELDHFLFATSLWKESQDSFLAACADYGAITMGLLAFVRVARFMFDAHRAEN